MKRLKSSTQQIELVTYVLNAVELTGAKNHHQYEKLTPVVQEHATGQEAKVLKSFFERTGIIKEKILTDTELSKLISKAKADIKNPNKKCFRFENVTKKLVYQITPKYTLLTQNKISI